MTSFQIATLALTASTITFAVLYFRQLNAISRLERFNQRDSLERDFYEMGRNIRDEMKEQERETLSRFKELETHLSFMFAGKDKEGCCPKNSTKPR